MTIHVCSECGAVFTEPYQSHGRRGDYPPGRRPECVGVLEAVEVVPRTVADALADVVDRYTDRPDRLLTALATYRATVNDDDDDSIERAEYSAMPECRD